MSDAARLGRRHVRPRRRARRPAGAAPCSTGSSSTATRRSSTPAAAPAGSPSTLAERLPRGRVIALDASPSMVEEARARLARFGDRVDVRRRRPRPAVRSCRAAPVDAILSTATFHWVPDHDALFRNLAAVLRPGGRLVAQCGGAGNIASVKAVLATIGDGWVGDAHYETPEATADGCARAGFVDVRDLARSPSRPGSSPASRSRRSSGR